MNIESLIKSRIAGLIVKFMMQESGYTVIPYSSDDILDRLIQAGVIKDNKNSKTLLNTPTFIVINEKKEPVFLKVKFKGRNKTGRNIDWGDISS